MNLLAFLAIQCRVEYLSDLRLTQRCKEILSKIESTTFLLGDWNETVHYLCKTDKSFEDVESAKKFLIKF